MIVTMKPILTEARKNGYGIIAANIFDETTVRAAVKAAENKKSPIILNISAKANPDFCLFSYIASEIGKKASVPVVINLDHGFDYETCIKAIKADFTSIMVDRSQLPFEDNIKEVAEIVKIAHTLGIPVEAELGHVGTGSQYDIDRNAALTEPSMAAEFVERTGCDCLAVAIGTAHGKYSGTPYLDFDRLKEIYNEVSVPLVLHGGSGTGDENLAKAARMGISKINIATDLVENGRKYLNESIDGRGRNLCDERAMLPLPSFYAGYQDKVEYYIDLFGSTNKAI